MTDAQVLQLVTENPGLEAWQLHDLARRHFGWRGWAPSLAMRLRRLDSIEWRESESRALWYPKP